MLCYTILTTYEINPDEGTGGVGGVKLGLWRFRAGGVK